MGALDVVTLALPKFAFFQLPLLKGKEANLRLYLRQVAASTSNEATVFRQLGSSDTPHAIHYASASARVAHKAQELGRANWEWVVAVLEACMRGVYEDLNDEARKLDAVDKKDLGNLHMFTMAGTIQAARRLVWADEPRWLKRCENTPQLKFCALQGADGDQRDIAVKMVEHCGLRQLTKLVEERRMQEGGLNSAAAEYLPNATREKLEEMTRSPELAAGLHAVLLAAFTTKGKGL